MGPLQELGARATAEAVYLVLVELGGQDVGALAARLDTSSGCVRAAVDELAHLGLVAGPASAPTVQPLPPRAPIEGLAETRAREAAVARRSASLLGELWTAHVESPSYLEVLTSTAAVVAASRGLHDEARTKVRALSIGPVGRAAVELDVAPGVAEALARGVSYRVVYGTRILRHPLASAR